MQDLAAEGQPLHVLEDASSAGSTAKQAAPLLKCAFRPAGAGSMSTDTHLPTCVATCNGDVASDVRASVSIWCCDSGHLLHRLSAGTSRAVADIAWSCCGRYIAAAAMSDVVYVWDAQTGAQKVAVKVEGAALAVSWAPGGLLSVGGTRGAASVINVGVDSKS